MEFRNLGRTEEQVSIIGMGTWQLAGMMGAVDRSRATELIRKAVDMGLTFVDTAEMYGDSEKQLGRALSDGYRDRVFLASKVSKDFTAGGVRKALENSLRDLRTDRIDLYQVHRYDPEVPVEQTLQTMEDLRDAGLIRYCGVSNFNVEQLRRAQAVCPIVSNQINYNALNRSAERRMIDYCREQGISVIAHSSLAKGILSGRYGPDHRFASGDERSAFPGYSGRLFAEYLALAGELRAAAEKEGLSLAQASILWLLAREGVTSVLVGPKNSAQLEESAEALAAPESARRIALRERMNEILESHGLPPLCPFPDQLV